MPHKQITAARNTPWYLTQGGAGYAFFSDLSFRRLRVGRILQQLGSNIHTGYKKLEGPLQKVALVPKVCISEIIIIPAEAEDAAAWRIVSQECCGKRVHLEKSDRILNWQQPDQV